MQASQAYVLEELPAPPVEQRRRLGSVAEHLASRSANLLIRDSDDRSNLCLRHSSGSCFRCCRPERMAARCLLSGMTPRSILR